MTQKQSDEGLSNLNPNFPSTDDDIVINTDSSVDIFADINDGAIVNQAPLLNAVNVNDKEPGKHHNQKPLPREWNPSLVHFKPTEAAVIVDSSEDSVIVSEHSESSAFIHEDDEVYFRESSESSETLTKEGNVSEGKHQTQFQSPTLFQNSVEGISSCSQHPQTTLGHDNQLTPAQSTTVPLQVLSPNLSQDQTPLHPGVNSMATKVKSNDVNQRVPFVTSTTAALKQPNSTQLNASSSTITISPPRKRYNFPEIAGKYKVLGKIGEGTFSSVYKAISLENPNEIVALKRIYPTSTPSRILNEIQLLRELGNEKAHVVCLKRILRHEDQVTLVLPYFAHDSFKEYVYTMTALQVKEYMRALFTALAHLHNHRDSNGQLKPVIHRDVKPGNFLYSMKDNTFALVDFGLAHYQDAENPYQPELPLLQTLIQPTRPPTQKQYTTSSTSTHPPPSSQNSALQNNDINNSNRKRKREENNFGDDRSSQQKRLRINQTGPVPVSPRQQNSSVSNIHHSNATLSQFQKERQKLLESLSLKSNSSVNPVQLISLVNQKQKVKRPVPLRGGTRGFRAPEVLLRCTKQTVAIDIWSAGVILLSILSARYPFFWSPDDMTSLAEIAVVCGSQQLIAAAASLGKRLVMSFESPKVNWKELCTKARGANKLEISDSVYDLLDRCLDVNPNTRITALEALEHPFFKS